MKKTGLILIALVFFCGITLVSAENQKRAASVIELNGSVDIKAGGNDWAPAKIGSKITEGDLIRTAKDSYAVLNVDGNGQTATVEVKANSQMSLSRLSLDKNSQTETTLLDLSLGQILVKAKKLHSEKSRFEVKTPTSIVGVRGTTFSVAVEAAQ